MGPSKELADLCLKLALEKDELDNYLGGVGEYWLTTNDSYGNSVFSSRHIMEAIYRRYEQDPSVLEKTQQAFLKIFSECDYSEKIFNAFEDIEFQMYCEKYHLAPFNMDFKTLSKAAKECIKKREQKFKSETSKTHDVWGQVIAHSHRLQEGDFDIL